MADDECIWFYRREADLPAQWSDARREDLAAGNRASVTQHGLTDDELEGCISRPPAADVLVYLVPGNPCLISFYAPYLSHLSKLLYRPGRTTVVGGCTLPGFQPSKAHAVWGSLPAGLPDQIMNVEELLGRASRRTSKVVLVGHSVGAYMVLEVLRRRAQDLNRLGDVNIAGAVLLFPTVVDIALSPHGRIMSVCTARDQVAWLAKVGLETPVHSLLSCACVTVHEAFDDLLLESCFGADSFLLPRLSPPCQHSNRRLSQEPDGGTSSIAPCS